MSKKTKKAKRTSRELTGREIKIIQLVGKDYTNQEVAKIMGMSPSWVDYMKGGIYRKIKCHTPIGMVLYGVKHNYIDLD